MSATAVHSLWTTAATAAGPISKIETPKIEYGQLSPTLIVVGAARFNDVRDHFLGTAVAGLTQRKAVLALGALQSPETGDYSVSYVFLSRPAPTGGAIAIMAHRCSGAPALAGTAAVVAAQIEFELRSVRRPGASAISVKGAMQDGHVHVTEAAEYGIQAGEASIDWPTSLARKGQIVDHLITGLGALLKSRKVTVLDGHGESAAPVG